MRRHLGVGAIDLRLVEAGLDDGGLGVVRHDELSEDTKRDYVRNVRKFAAFLGQSPGAATSEDLRRYQLHMAQLNDRQTLRRLGVTRHQLLDEVDRPALKALPGEPYEYSEWRACRVGVDYHVEIASHYYSVPYRFARAEVEARLTARGVEIFHKGERIAVHLRASGNRKHTTVSEHMPSSHRRYAGWTIERIREDARKIGKATAALCEQLLESRPHPEQGYRACLGIVRLAGSYGAARVEAAAERAIEIGARTYGSVKSILDNKLDRRPAPRRPADTAPIRHPNIRGPRYYH